MSAVDRPPLRRKRNRNPTSLPPSWLILRKRRKGRKRKKKRKKKPLFAGLCTSSTRRRPAKRKKRTRKRRAKPSRTIRRPPNMRLSGKPGLTNRKNGKNRLLVREKINPFRPKKETSRGSSPRGFLILS